MKQDQRLWWAALCTTIAEVQGLYSVKIWTWWWLWNPVLRTFDTSSVFLFSSAFLKAFSWLANPPCTFAQWSESRSVLSNRLRTHGLYSPWDSPGQNTRVGSLSLLQGIFPTQGSNPGIHIAGGFFTSWATKEAQHLLKITSKAASFFTSAPCKIWAGISALEHCRAQMAQNHAQVTNLII